MKAEMEMETIKLDDKQCDETDALLSEFKNFLYANATSASRLHNAFEAITGIDYAITNAAFVRIMEAHSLDSVFAREGIACLFGFFLVARNGKEVRQ